MPPSIPRSPGDRHPVIDRALAAHGRDRVRDTFWAAPGALEIRPVFALYLQKGARVVPLWGVSLGFVPHVSGDRAPWHRTRKSARPDLWETPTAPRGALGRAGAEDKVAERVQAALTHGLPGAECYRARARAGDADGLRACAGAWHMLGVPLSAPPNAGRDIARAFIASRRGETEAARATLAAIKGPNPAARAARAARLDAVRARGPGQPR